MEPKEPVERLAEEGEMSPQKMAFRQRPSDFVFTCPERGLGMFGRSLCKNRAHQTAAHDVGGSYLFYHMARPGQA